MAAGFTKIEQLGFLVENLEEAAAAWTKRGVGPFFFWNRIEYPIFRFRGVDSQPELSLAFSYVGDVQIELVQQFNDAPSVFAELRSQGRTGLVHMAQFTFDPAAASATLRQSGAELIQYGRDHEGLEVWHFDAAPHHGGLIEFIGTNAARAARRERMKQAAAAWDGREPFRDIMSLRTD